MTAVNIAVRVLHIGSAIALLGGTIFFLVVLIPTVRILDEGLRTSILQLARKRFYRISHPALLLLAATGLYTYLSNLHAYDNPKALHGLIGMKILLWVAITSIVFAQTFGVLRGCPIRWAKVNLTLGIAVIIIAAVVRTLRIGM
jgi:uncharacterized membrane protein